MRYTLAEIKNYPGDIFTLRFRPQAKNPVYIKPGQYFYIKGGIFSEAHPFSVLEFNDKTGDITFGIKKLGKYSSHLSSAPVEETYYIDGPFGEFTFEGQNSDPKVILAGGIGITPFYELVARFGNKNTYLFYANRNTASALYRDKFKKLLDKNHFDFVNEAPSDEENVFCELISTGKIKQLLKNEKLSNLKFFICGSPIFTKTMISCLIELGVNKKSIFIEEFEY